MCFVFYENLEAAEKKTKQNKVFLSISLQWLNNAPFGKEIAVGLSANQVMSNVYLSVH